MKRTISILVTVIAMALQPLVAQTSDNYNYYKAVELLDEGGDPKEARQLVTELLEENPKHIESYLLLATLDRLDKDYASAMSQIDQAMKMNHRKSGVCNSTIMWWKATIYSDVKEIRKAVDVMKEAVAVAKKRKSEYVTTMLSDLGHYYYLLKDYDSSDRCYDEMFRLDESEVSAKIGIARNMIDRQKYEEALAILEECRRYDADYPQVYKYQMLAYERMKEYRKMIDSMVALYEKSEDSDWLESSRFMKDRKYSFALVKEKIAEGKDDFIWRVVLAELYDECHMNKELLVSINGLISDYGDNPELLEKRADVYEELGLYDESLADIDRAIEIDKSNEAFYHSYKCIIYSSAGMYDEAEAEIEKYIERYPRDAYGYYSMGWCKELSGDDQGAMAAYEDGIAVDEEFAYIYLMRANMNLKWGKMELAKEDSERILKLDTLVEDGSCRHYALHFLGRDDEAMEWMDKILESDPDNPGHWYDKSCLMCRMGMADEAMSVLKTAFEKGYRRFSHIEHDDDIDAIRDRDDFKALVETYKRKFEEERREICSEAVVGSEDMVTEVVIKKKSSGTYEVPCSVNGLPLKMIFDTGASDVTISSVEAGFMLKNGYLADSDVKGRTHYMTASGDIHEGTILKLKEVKLGDAVLKNVEASVVHSQNAPLLLGQSVLEKFGTITIDNVNSKLIIRQ